MIEKGILKSVVHENGRRARANCFYCPGANEIVELVTLGSDFFQFEWRQKMNIGESELFFCFR